MGIDQINLVTESHGKFSMTLHDQNLFFRFSRPGPWNYFNEIPNAVQEGSLSSDVILGPVNFGNHWCLVAEFPERKMMIYLDFLFYGAHAEESFQRMKNFFESVRKWHQMHSIHRLTGRNGCFITYRLNTSVNRPILTIVASLCANGLKTSCLISH